MEREVPLPRLSGRYTLSQRDYESDAGRRKLVKSPSIRKETELTLTLRQDLHRVILELRRVTVRTSGTEQTQELIQQGPNDHHHALSTRMDQQHQDMIHRFDALEKLVLNEQPQVSSRLGQISIPSEEGTVSQTLHIYTSHRIPCRGWCPCACHAKQKLKMRVPGMIESVLGKMFVGYSGLPVLNKACDFRVCRDRQNAAATVEYCFPSWFVSMNLKLHLTYLPLTGPQFQLSTTRRVADNSQSISFAMQGNTDGLRYLFGMGLASPRDVSDSRGFTLMRVSLLLTIMGPLYLMSY